MSQAVKTMKLTSDSECGKLLLIFYIYIYSPRQHSAAQEQGQQLDFNVVKSLHFRVY